MSRVTRFAARDPGAAARVAGFMAHLRENGLKLGVAETELALEALGALEAPTPDAAGAALKAVCTGCADDYGNFDALFNAYWRDAGRVRQKIVPTSDSTPRQHMRSTRQARAMAEGGAGDRHSPDGDGEGDAAADGEGRLIASTAANLMKKDLRDLVSPEDIREAERIARRLGAALRDRRSRRRIAARKGMTLDFRRIVRKSLATGGEPLALPKRQRPNRDMRIVALCDVSGSMTAYARPFLAFLAGLLRADQTADAYLFHTRLVRITEALRDEDPLRALNRLTLLADGFGGGTKAGRALDQFARTYARRFVTGRTVVVILSDGYDADPPEYLGTAVEAIKRRGCRIVWLNPLKGWRDYAPVAGGMAAALPHIDLFAAANTLEALAGLEGEFGCL
ncbi:MAG: VWA domain-containing protein [Pseudomonadota bacterium]